MIEQAANHRKNSGQKLSTIFEDNSTDNKFAGLSKKSNIRNMLPPIEFPEAKRKVMKDEVQQLKQKQINLSAQKQKKGKITNQTKKESAKQNKIKKQKKQKSAFNVAKLFLEEYRNKTDYAMVKKYAKIAQILSYLYNQFPKIQNKQKKQISKGRVYNQWQLIQIQQNYYDTHLGDFVIKMVNPDLLPKNYIEKKKIDKNTRISFLQAIQKYQQMFSSQKITDKFIDQCQKQAFHLAFYLLQFQGALSTKQTRQKQEQVNNFIKNFNYICEIAPLTYVQYLELKKKADFKQRQLNLDHRIYLEREALQKIYFNANFSKQQIQKKFNSYKKNIYEMIKKDTLGNYKQLNRRQQPGKYQQYKWHMSCLLSKISSISQLLLFFPDLITIFFNDIKYEQYERHTGKDEESGIHRKFSSGGYLSQISHNNQLKWILNRQRPNDVLTLLRKFMVYRLTRRGGLFIRSFLSKQQTHLFLVIKASQQHLQKMAQQSNFNMEVQLGSIDIFSFQPVDKYGRPLRCNKYVRDLSFIKKYNLVYNKEDKDSDLGDKSVQSQALNIYKKATKMNKQELRAKIILDQQECDSCFSWLSTKTGASLIQPTQILNNKYNQEEIQNDIWPIYYIYNKMIIQYITRLRTQLAVQKQNKIILQNLNDNIGLILRLMFLKTLNFCNNLYRKHRKSRFKLLKNLFLRKHPLETIWNQIGQDVPRGYYPYFYSARLQKIWRKFEINQQKDRSKFSPATRLIITNQIIRQYLNISKSIMQEQIIDFYPIHDPFILKNIRVRPYLNVLAGLIDEDQRKLIEPPDLKNKSLSDTFVEYECEYTKQDFTKQSMRQKLKFKCLSMTDFSVNSVAFYCGQKLALFFQFRRYLTSQVWPLSIITFILQIIFWVENTHIVEYGSSYLTSFNNVMMIILIFVNTLFVQRTISGWIQHQKKMARSFGTNDLQKNNKKLKRLLFQGTMKRNLQTDEMNDQQANRLITLIKQFVALLVNVIFIVLMGSTILIIFTLKSQLFQRGYAQSTVTAIPAILIAIAIQVFTLVYNKIIGFLVEFENKKTIPQYQSSLTSKSYIVTFIITYFAIFIYGFFSQYFEGDTVCSILTNTGTELNNCYYYISNQVVISTSMDLFLTVFMAFYPLAAFFLRRHFEQKQQNSNIMFNLNYFQSIDCFYEQQDRMSTYMYTDQIDRTWEGYTQIVITFTTLVLFAPIVPFLYIMMFLIGVVSLNAKKYQIIYFSKRTLPIKVKSIGVWIRIIRVIGVIGVFTNVALVIYVRNVITQDRAIVFFSAVFVILVLKYIMSFTNKNQDDVGKRCKVRTQQLISQKRHMSFVTSTSHVNTDIQNLFYDQRKLNRKLPDLKGANVRYK